MNPAFLKAGFFIFTLQLNIYMKKIIGIVFIVLFLIGGYCAWQVFGPTVSAPADKYFYVKTGAVYSDVKQTLMDEKMIGNTFIILLF